MSDDVRKAFVDLIDAFNKVWVRPERWNEDQIDEHSIRIRDIWALERDDWTVNLLDLLRTWLLYPGDGPDAAGEDELPSWKQSIAAFKDNMTLGAETAEMRLLSALDGRGEMDE